MSDRERVLASLRELELADEKLGAVLAELDEVARQTDAVRERAAALLDFEARLPGEREQADAELAGTRAEVEGARESLGAAREALARAGEKELADARRFEVRARDRLAVAERRRAEAEASSVELERRAQEAETESQVVQRRASELAEALRGKSRIAEGASAAPAPGLDGVAAWEEGARAALFVARGQLTAEREAVIRQANELGAVALGEPLSAIGAAAVARRIEAELR